MRVGIDARFPGFECALKVAFATLLMDEGGVDCAESRRPSLCFITIATIAHHGSRGLDRLLRFIGSFELEQQRRPRDQEGLVLGAIIEQEFNVFERHFGSVQSDIRFDSQIVGFDDPRRLLEQLIHGRDRIRRAASLEMGGRQHHPVFGPSIGRFSRLAKRPDRHRGTADRHEDRTIQTVELQILWILVDERLEPRHRFFGPPGIEQKLDLCPFIFDVGCARSDGAHNETRSEQNREGGTESASPSNAGVSRHSPG